jgi:hypothetical protein
LLNVDTEQLQTGLHDVGISLLRACSGKADGPTCCQRRVGEATADPQQQVNAHPHNSRAGCMGCHGTADSRKDRLRLRGRNGHRLQHGEASHCYRLLCSVDLQGVQREVHGGLRVPCRQRRWVKDCAQESSAVLLQPGHVAMSHHGRVHDASKADQGQVMATVPGKSC